MSKVVIYKISKASLHKQKQTTHTHKFLVIFLFPFLILIFYFGWFLGWLGSTSKTANSRTKTEES